MRLLVALDRSAPAQEALEYALTEYPDAEITVLHVINPIDGSYGEDFYAYEYVVESQQEAATELLEEAEATADAHGQSIDTVSVIGQPAREIVRYAEEHSFGHVIVGSHGRSGVSRVLLGSVAEQVVRRAHVPVTVVR